jgi:tetratricopeptide (TPR) repeat protein
MLKTIRSAAMALFACAACLTACQPSAEERLQEARKALETNQLPEAIRVLDALLEQEPQHAEALNMRGVAHIRLDQFTEAAIDFDRAIAIDPNNYKYYFNRGNIKMDINQPAAAAEDYARALAIDSTQQAIWLRRAACLHALGDYPEAVADFEGALRHGPPTADLAFSYAYSLKAVGADPCPQFQLAQSLGHPEAAHALADHCAEAQ